MRIVGGRLGGRALAAPKSQGTFQGASKAASLAASQESSRLAQAPIRPTSDRLRESLFNILLHSYGDPVSGARVLDLFAGTGALGLEAMSRGAAFALFIDDGAAARALIRANVEALGLGGTTKIFRRDATQLGPVHPLEPFTLAFLDPPYRDGLAEKSLAALAAGGWLAPGALVVVEEAADAAFAPPAGFAEIERRRYDDSELTFLRAAEP
jgi:16S rRNA (guanine966-N2)-methyltransferase